MRKFVLIVCSLLLCFKGVTQPLSGTYTIGGASPNYITWANAVEALKNEGISGPVIFKVREGQYNEQVSIPNITGSSEINTITFESEDLDTAKVEIYYNPTPSNPYTIELNGAKNFIIRYLTIKSTNVNNARPILLKSQANNNSFENNRIIGPVSNSTSSNLSLIHSSSSGNNRIIGNHLLYGAFGLYITGSAEGLVVQDNIFDLQYYRTIQLQNQIAPVIVGNKITSSSYNQHIGVYLQSCTKGLRIENNSIISLGGTGIYLSSTNGLDEERGRIINNFISVRGTSTAVGLNLFYSSYHQVFHNNIGVFSTHLTAGKAVELNRGDSLDIFNNVFANRGGGYSIYVTNSNYNSDYNDLNVTGNNFGYFNGVVSTLEAWKSLTNQEFNSINSNPLFVSQDDLHVSQIDLYKNGSDFPGITLDFDGDNRDVLNPTIGADEFTPPQSDIGIIAISNPRIPFSEGTKDVKITLKNYGGNTINSAKIDWKVNEVSQTSFSWTGSLEASKTIEVTVGSFVFNSGTKYDIEATSSLPNGESDSNPLNDNLASRNLFAGLEGTYTIGGNLPDFDSIGNAVEALINGGVVNAVTFNIRPGTYNEQVSLNNYPGNGCENPVIFQSENGDSTSVIISRENTSNSNYVWRLNGVSGVTLKHLNIKTLNNIYYNIAIEIMGGSHCNKITGNILESPVTTYTGESSSVIHSTTDSDTGNVIENNRIENGSIGIYYEGVGDYETGTVIRNNEIIGQHYQGVYLSRQISPIIEGNTLISKETPYSNYFGFNLYACSNELRFVRNNVQSGSGYGLYMYDCNGTSTERGLVANNFISAGGTGLCRGLDNSHSDYVDFYFNNVHVYGTHATNGRALNVVSGTNNNIKNNVFANTGGGYAVYTNTTNFTSDYNDLYTSGANLGYYSGNRISLTEWQASGSWDENSVSSDPLFVSNTDLHVNKADLDSAGVTVTEVSTDYDGETRGTPPDIGADEFTPTGTNGALTNLEYPQTPFSAGDYTIKVALKNSGIARIDSAIIGWSVNGENQPEKKWTGSLSTGGADTVSLGSVSFSQITSYAIEVWLKKVNEGNDIDAGDDSIGVSDLYTELSSGTYTIGGTNPDFDSIIAATNVLNLGGISGAVTFNIRPGTYDEQVSLNNYPGNGCGNPVIFQSENGDSTSVIISRENTSNSNYVWRLNGVSGVTLKHLNIKTLNNIYYNIAIEIMGGSHCNKITGNILESPVTTYTGESSSVIHSTTDSDTGNVIENNRIENGSIGIYYEGVGDYETGTVIRNNEIIGQHYQGVYLSRQISPIIEGNTLISKETPYSNYFGFNLYACSNELRFVRNNVQSGSGYGLYMYDCNGTSTERGLVANNFISAGGTGLCRGLDNSHSDYVDFYFNNVHVYGTHATNGRALNVVSGTNNNIKNNVFANTGGGYAVYTNTTNFTSDYNDLYTSGANLGYYSGNRISLTEWQASGSWDENSVSSDPLFVSDTDLHVNKADLDSAGVTVTEVSTDYDGETRGTPPDIGADEFTPTGTNGALTNLEYPQTPFSAGDYTIKVALKNSGIARIDSAIIGWSVNGENQPEKKWTGSLSTGGADTVSLGSVSFSQITSYAIEVWLKKVNEGNDIDAGDDSIGVSDLYTELSSGTYTIGGTNPDFDSITAAINVLNLGGISGAVTFNIRPGTYDEQVSLNNYPGNGCGNPVIFQSENGDSTSVIISRENTSNSNYVWRLNGVSGVTLKHLNIKTLNNIYYNIAIEIMGGSHCNKITGNILESPVTTYTGESSSVIHSTTDSDTGNVIENNRIENGSIGIYYEGVGDYETGTVIRNNEIIGQHYQGVYLSRQISPIIEGNTLISKETPYSNYFGFNLYACSNELRFVRNNVQSGSGYGLYMYDCNGTSTERGLVANNFISAGGTGLCRGLDNSHSDYVDFYFNNVHVYGTHATNGRALNVVSGTNNNIKNNVFANTGGGYAVYTNTTNFTSDYNDLYTTGANLGYYSGNRISLAEWQAAESWDGNSISENPNFISNTDLHVSNVSLNARAVLLPEVQVDFDGQTRDPITPDIGADEFGTAVADAGLIEFISPVVPFPVGNNTITVAVLNNATQNLESLQLNWEINNIAQTPFSWTGLIEPGEKANIQIGTYDFNEFDQYNVKVWVSNPNGEMDQNPANDTVSVHNIFTALSGVYEIGGQSLAFNALGDAVEALKLRGVSGKVTFKINAGFYEEQLRISKIKGASEINTITFRPNSDENMDVEISFNSPSDKNYIINLDSATHIHFERIKFKALNNSYGKIIWLQNRASNNEFKENIFNGIVTSSTSGNLTLIHSQGGGRENLFENNLLNHGVYGIYLNDVSGRLGSAKISNNVFNDQSYRSIWVEYQNNLVVEGNKLAIDTSRTNYIGIYLSQCHGDLKVLKNDLQIGNGSYGMNFYYCSKPFNGNSIVVNNFISMGGPASSYGIYMESSDQALYYNNVHLFGTNGNSRTLYISNGSGIVIQNNILSNQTGGQAVYVNTPNSIFKSDYNDLYVTGSILGYWSGTRANLSDWRSGSGQDGNSLSVDPLFESNTDLHVKQGQLDGAAKPVAGITDDIDGQQRDAVTPDIGADEVNDNPEIDLAILEILSPITKCDLGESAEVVVKVKNTSSELITFFKLTYEIPGVGISQEDDVIQNILSGDEFIYTFSNNLTIPNLDSFEVMVHLKLDGDINPTNDTLISLVKPLPEVNLVLTADTTINYGDTITLEANGGTTYFWEGELNGENPNNSNISVTPLSDQTYYVTVTNSDGCFAKDSVKVTVNPIENLPDLEMNNVNSVVSQAEPGDTMEVFWEIKNIGTLFSLTQWTEKIYIESSTGQNRKLITTKTVNEEDTLDIGEVYQGSANVILPEVLSIGDSGVFVVEVIPSANVKELPFTKENNIGIEQTPWDIVKKLSLTLAKTEINESGSGIYCTVSRSGNTASSLAVEITVSDSTKFTYPKTVTIPYGQSGRSFYIYPVNNDLLEGDLDLAITASSQNFESSIVPIKLIDDESPSITIRNLASEVAEGDTLRFNLVTDFVFDDTVFVNIISSKPIEAPLPTPIAILPGDTSALVEVVLPDDSIAEPDQTIEITVGSDGFNSAFGIFVLTNDSDIPAITFELSIDSVSESAGLYATQGTIKRLGSTNEVLSIDLSSSEPSALYMPSKVPLGPGESEKTFYIGVLDNNTVDGFRDIEIKASVLLSTCGCTASETSAGVFRDTLTVADNDGPTLTLQVNPLSLPEGKSNAGFLTIKRNTTTTEELTVNLTHNDSTEIELPSSVVIPIGSASIKVPITTKSDTLSDGNQQVSIKASAQDFSPGIVWVFVTDINKPDFQVPLITVENDTVPSFEEFPFHAFITNQGVANAPSGAVLVGYLSIDENIDENDYEIGEFVIDEPIFVGDTLDYFGLGKSPMQPGNYHLIFRINKGDRFTETIYINNTSPSIPFTVLPDYYGSAEVSEDVFLQGSKIEIYGSSFKEPGVIQPNADLEVYILNGGFRREILVTTDSLGYYSTQFEPAPHESGHYSIGASFPNFNATVAQDEFDILGVKINNGKFVYWEFVLGDTLTGALAVENLSQEPLTNVTLEPISLESGAILTFDTISTLAGLEKGVINYSVQGTKVSPIGSYQKIPIAVMNDGQKIQEFKGYYFCQALEAFITSEVTSIKRFVSQKKSNFLEFRIFNTGLGETGEVSVKLPQQEFMSLTTLPLIPNISSGDTGLVILEFKPTETLPLNTPASGTIVVNAENGNHITIPYVVEKVSDKKGGLVVDVVDEYSYFTEEKPHVDSAFVKISHYFTGEVYASGYTNNDGLFSIDSLPEGLLRLQVQADKHKAYDNTVNILPGTTITETVFISYQAISFSWDVKKTTVEDTYLVDLIMEFETNVPVPVVTVDVPDSLPELFGTEEFNFFMTLTNKGLIRANDVVVHLPKDSVYEFVTDYIPADLSAQQAIQIPVTMRVRGANSPSVENSTLAEISEQLNIDQSAYNYNFNGAGGCLAPFVSAWNYFCGGNSVSGSGAASSSYSGRSCGGPPGGGSNNNPGGGCPGCGGGDPSDPVNNIPNSTSELSCDCAVDLILAVGGCAPPPYSVISCGISIASSGSAGDVGVAIMGCLPRGIGCVTGLIKAYTTCYPSNLGFSSIGPHPTIELAFTDLREVEKFYNANFRWLEEYYGSITKNENVKEFAQEVALFIDSVKLISEPEGDIIKSNLGGFDLSEAEIDAFIDRWNTTVKAWGEGVTSPNPTYPNIVDQAVLDSTVAEAKAGQEYAESRGFNTVGKMHKSALDRLNDYGKNNLGVNTASKGSGFNKSSASKNSGQGAVCAKVTIQISQKVTMTREAFEGTLKVVNGHPTDNVDSLSLNLEILDPNGVLSNDLFQIELTDLKKLTGIDGTGKIGPEEEGSAVILFIPEPGAAPTVPISYSFGGSISYFDPYSNLMVTRPLSPATLQVNPSPDLFLHYFMQRNIYGDDPLTTPIEPIIPAELAVMVENNGFGNAMNLTIESAQPEIIDNEKGLSIGFKLIGSNLQGKPANLGLNTINFGDISPKTAKVGQWYFTSTLLGHFINYKTNLVHLDSYGNPDLSLISGAKLHELIQSITVYDDAVKDGINDFLVNEVDDPEDIPDAIFLSQGQQILDVFPADSGYFTGDILASGNTTKLFVDPMAIGWNYLKLDDPGRGNFKILSITRDYDGQEIPLTNGWLTHVTLPDSKVPNYEDKFHFVDNFIGTDEISYTIKWSPKDPNPPFVVKIEGHPNAVTSEQVTNLKITFSEEIIDSTFTYEDLMLTLQGSDNLMDSTVIITEIDSVTYNVDISSLTTGNGYYVFTAQAAGIKDLTGTNGEVGKQVSWTQFLSVPSIKEFIGLPSNNTSNKFDSLQVLFNLPIDTTTLTSDKFSVKYGGVSQSGTLGITSLNAENTLFQLVGIGTFMGADGDYELVADLENIRSTDSVYGLAPQTIVLKLDTEAPQLINLVRFKGQSLDDQHYTGVNLNFNEPVNLFDTSAVDLTRNGIKIPLGDAKVSMLNSSGFKIESFKQLTYPDGNYAFKIDLEKISDLAGNFGSGMEETTWVVNRSSNLEISDLNISPDLGYSDTDGVTASLELDVSFILSDSSSNIKLFQNNNGTLSLLEELDTIGIGSFSISVSFTSGGNTGILVRVVDLRNNVVEKGRLLYIDETALTGKWDYDQNQKFTEHPIDLPLSVSNKLLDTLAINAGISATFNNTEINASDLWFERISDTEFILKGIDSLPEDPGQYSVMVDVSLLKKYRTGISGKGIAKLTWEITNENNNEPIADAGRDSTITSPTVFMLDGSGSFDPDEDVLEYKWYPPAGVVLDDDEIVNPSFTITNADHGKIYEFLLSVSDGYLFSTDVVEITIDLAGDFEVDIDVLMEGPYDTNGTMKTTLNQANVLPTSQPYNQPPWNYAGTEELDSIPSNIVDWVLVSLRTALSKDSVVTTKAVLLRNDGQIVGLDGLLPNLEVPTKEDSFYVVVYHRNHLGVMSASPISGGDGISIDFTKSKDVVFGGQNGIKDLGDGNFGMFGGDADANGQVQNIDLNIILPKLGLSGYKMEDVDMNNQIQNIDIQNKTTPNVGRGVPFDY